MVMSLDNIFIIVPTYNEKDNIESLIKRLQTLSLDFILLIIDDSSPDGTAEKIKNLQKVYSNICLIIRDTKAGLGSAYKEGFKKALAQGAEVIVQMDADLSHSPEDIIPMLNCLSESSMVVGSRYVLNGGILNWSFFRLFLSKTANLVSKYLLRIPVNDLTSGYKVIKREVLESIDFSNIKSKGYVFQMELILRTYDKGFKIKEYPIIFKGREKEKSKFSLGIVLEALARVIYFSFKRSRK